MRSMQEARGITRDGSGRGRMGREGMKGEDEEGRERRRERMEKGEDEEGRR